MKKKIVMITFGAIGMIIFTISLQKLIKYYQRKRKEKLIISDNEKNGDEGSLDEESAVQ
jgi:predicted GIY-YIG superfamily endonuclease